MYDQSLTEYRQILSDIKTDLGWNKLQPEDKNQEDLVRGILLLARKGSYPQRKVMSDEGPQFMTRDPLADVLLAILNR
jgi:hypothetical protein|tara:strand:+ start:178 stop:411 length:234 start_codon:yes stop_codon:yes gene_type:complete